MARIESCRPLDRKCYRDLTGVRAADLPLLGQVVPRKRDNSSRQEITKASVSTS